MSKRIFRSKSNKFIAGVCAGIAEYFDIDPTIVRLAWVALTLLSCAFPGILLYIIAMIVIPSNRLEIQ